MLTEQKCVTPFLKLKIFLVEKICDKRTLCSIFVLKTNVVKNNVEIHYTFSVQRIKDSIRLKL